MAKQNDEKDLKQKETSDTKSSKKKVAKKKISKKKLAKKKVSKKKGAKKAKDNASTEVKQSEQANVEPSVTTKPASVANPKAAGLNSNKQAHGKLTSAGFLYSVLILILILGVALLYKMLTYVPHDGDAVKQETGVAMVITSGEIVIPENMQLPIEFVNVKSLGKPATLKPLPLKQVRLVEQALGIKM